jgi:predicted O-methyltransferase YrrM
MIDISRAVKIPGWMGDDELRWLGEQAKLHDVIVEVGCWMGRSTLILAENAKNVVYAVDTWSGSDEHKEMLVGKPPEWLYEQFLARLGMHASVTMMRTTSLDAAKRFEISRVKPDMVFLDASHDEAAIAQDIRAWKALLADGGLLCGHDYQPSWPGVIAAVDQLLPGARKIDGDANSIWYWRPKQCG